MHAMLAGMAYQSHSCFTPRAVILKQDIRSAQTEIVTRLTISVLYLGQRYPSENRHAQLRSVQWGIADWICSR